MTFLVASSCTEQRFGIELVRPSHLLEDASPIPGGPSTPTSPTPSNDPIPVLVAQSDSFNPRSQTTASFTISPKVKLLFMVDNSGSTAKYQTQLSDGFSNFAAQYFKAGVDLTVAAITSDTYLAGRTGTSADKYGPNLGQCYTRLMPGIHDGVRPSIADAFENPFISNTCSLTDAARVALMAAGTRSLRPILSTLPPDGSVPNAAYFQKLIADFKLNVLPGTAGAGRERGFESVHRFLADNEERAACSTNPVQDPSCFFGHYDTKNVLKPQYNGIIFVSDEHDHTGGTDLGVAGGPVLDHIEETIRTMDDATMKSSSVLLAGQMKKRLDKFFTGIHEAGVADPNYSVFSIVNINCEASKDTRCGFDRNGRRDDNERWGIEYNALVDAYLGNDGANGRPVQVADTVNSAAKYSKLFDINQTNYDSLFKFIGDTVVTNTKTVLVTQFTLSKPAADLVNIKASIVLSNGSVTPIPSQQITLVNASTLVIDAAALANIPANDPGARVQINYFTK